MDNYTGLMRETKVSGETTLYATFGVNADPEIYETSIKNVAISNSRLVEVANGTDKGRFFVKLYDLLGVSADDMKEAYTQVASVEIQSAFGKIDLNEVPTMERYLTCFAPDLR